MNNIEIIDNFLDVKICKSMYEKMSGPEFPWFYNKTITGFKIDDKDSRRLQFTHMFYDNHIPRSNLINIISPIIDKINPKALIRVKANLGVFDIERTLAGFHTDYEFSCKTAIYYLNTNNGYTIFENGKKIESVENRFVSFDSKLKHSGIPQTDTKDRILININYFD